MADGKTCDTVESVIISVTTDAGITGWGEVCPIPHYLPAYARGVAPALSELAPIILGADPIGPEAVMARAQDWLQGHVYAKSALDIALWDITGQAADLPLYHSITCIAPEDMARIAADAQGEGITQFQVKLGADAIWEADVAAKDTASLLKGHALGVMDAVALKLSKFGGLSETRKARDLCLYLGAKMCIEDTWGSDITTAALSHLGAATDPRQVLNVCDLSGYVVPHVAPDGPLRKNGRLAPPDAPGLGISPDPDILGAPDLVLE